MLSYLALEEKEKERNIVWLNFQVDRFVVSTDSLIRSVFIFDHQKYNFSKDVINEVQHLVLLTRTNRLCGLYMNAADVILDLKMSRGRTENLKTFIVKFQQIAVMKKGSKRLLVNDQFSHWLAIRHIVERFVKDSKHNLPLQIESKVIDVGIVSTGC